MSESPKKTQTQKRCPKGFQRDRRTKECVRKSAKIRKSPSPSSVHQAPASPVAHAASPVAHAASPKQAVTRKQPRCPKGFRRSKDGICRSNNNPKASRNAKSEHKTMTPQTAEPVAPLPSSSSAVDKKSFAAAKKQIKQWIDELKPALKTLTKQEKKQMKDHLEQLELGMQAEADHHGPVDFTKHMANEKQLADKHTRTVIDMSRHFKSQPVPIRIAQLKHLQFILNGSTHEDELAIAIVRNI